MFDKVKANRLPEHRPYHYPIDLLPEKEPPWGSIYNISHIEQEVVQEYISENLANGFIQTSRSPTGASIFFVTKKDGSLHLVVDFRRLNNYLKLICSTIYLKPSETPQWS